MFEPFPQTGAARTNGPVYAYTPAGRLQQRTWERGVTTTYGYNDAGDLESVTYSDNTPGTTNGYDRRGRLATVTNGTAVCNFTYDDASRLLTETYTAGPLAGLAVTNGYDQFLRRTNLTLVNAQGTVLARTTNSYDSAGRLAAVGAGSASATYSYLANSPLVEQIAFANSGTVMTTKKTYDLLNRLTDIRTVDPQSALLSSFAYVQLGQSTHDPPRNGWEPLAVCL